METNKGTTEDTEGTEKGAHAAARVAELEELISAKSSENYRLRGLLNAAKRRLKLPRQDSGEKSVVAQVEEEISRRNSKLEGENNG